MFVALSVSPMPQKNTTKPIQITTTVLDDGRLANNDIYITFI
jgi:hypothetical protein